MKTKLSQIMKNYEFRLYILLRKVCSRMKEKESYYIIRVNKQHAVLSNIVCGTTCQSGAFR